MVVADGEDVWAYSSKHNQYTRKPVSEEPTGFLRYFRAPLLVYEAAPDESHGAQLLREDTIDVGGKRAACFVIQVRRSRQPGTATWWIDKTRFVVLRDDEERPSLDRDQALANAPDRDGAFFRVPRIIED